MKFLKYIIGFSIALALNSYATTLDYGLTVMNKGGYEKAKEIFRPLSQKGNSVAMYWLAYTQFKTSETISAGDSLLKSANSGNPWAMGVLAGSELEGVERTYCSFLSWPCEERWADLAIEGWRKLAEKGDGKAMYALLKYDKKWWQYVPIYKYFRYGELAEEIYLGKGYSFFFDDEYWSKRNESLRIKYMEKIARSGFLLAAYNLAYLYQEKGDFDKALYWFNYGVQKNDYYSLKGKALSVIYINRDKDIGSNQSKKSTKAYFYCRAAKEIYSNHDCKLSNYFEHEVDKYGELMYFDEYSAELVTLKDIKEIEREAKEKVDGSSANLYLDETTVEFFKGFRKNI